MSTSLQSGPGILTKVWNNAASIILHGHRSWRLARTAIVDYGAIQKVRELSAFTSWLQKQKLDTVLEIGTASGGTYHLFCQIASPTAILIGLDLPAQDRFRAT